MATEKVSISGMGYPHDTENNYYCRIIAIIIGSSVLPNEKSDAGYSLQTSGFKGLWVPLSHKEPLPAHTCQLTTFLFYTQKCLGY